MSGFIVAHKRDQTVILTNKHVVEGVNDVFIQWPNGDVDRGLVSRDSNSQYSSIDLALIRVFTRKGKAIPCRKSTLRRLNHRHNWQWRIKNFPFE